MKIHLLEATYKEHDTGTIKTLYVSTNGYTTKPTDIIPNQHYDADIITPLVFDRSALVDGVLGGIGEGGYGICELINNGKYDIFRKYGFDGRQIRWLSGEDTDAYADMQVILVGTMAQPEFTESIFGLRIRDNTELLSKNIQSTMYAGNNSLPNGLEGVEGDLKGKPKPLCFGKVYNIEPPLVNTSKVVYQVHDGIIQSVDGVYSNGAALTFYQNFSDSTALLAATIPAGNYATCLNEGLFRLNNNGATVITADVKGCALASDGGYVYKPADITRRIVKRQASFADANIATAAFTAMNAKATYETGIYISPDETPSTVQVLNSYLSGFCIFAGFNRAGLFTIARFDGIVGNETVAASLDELQIIWEDFQVVPTFSFGDGNVPYRVKLNYQYNHRVLGKTEQAGIISTDPARAAWLQQEWRDIQAEDINVQSLHLLASVFEYETFMNIASEATTEAARVLALYKNRIDRLIIKIRADDANGIDFGSFVKITLPRLEMDAGKIFLVIGIKEDYADDIVTLEVIGNG